MGFLSLVFMIIFSFNAAKAETFYTVRAKGTQRFIFPNSDTNFKKEKIKVSGLWSNGSGSIEMDTSDVILSFNGDNLASVIPTAFELEHREIYNGDVFSTIEYDETRADDFDINYTTNLEEETVKRILKRRKDRLKVNFKTVRQASTCEDLDINCEGAIDIEIRGVIQIKPLNP